MTKCFISYSRKDSTLAESLVATLRAANHKVWIDLEIEGGTQWEHELQRALGDADVCIVILTPNSITSQYVKQEIELARTQQKLVIPLVMYEIQLPAGLEKLHIADVQYINFLRDGYKFSMEQLLKILREKQSAQPSNVKLKALVIEDIPADQIVIKQILHRTGLEVNIAKDFAEALEYIRNSQFHLVTLDMQLDVMDTDGQHGRLLLSELRTYKPDVPIIIISRLNLTGKQVRDFLFEQKAFDFVSKPFNPDDLHIIVERAIKIIKG